jgi:outer membrane protein assembly factor BamE (lipoprotein component of BamABCDE complex)
MNRRTKLTAAILSPVVFATVVEAVSLDGAVDEALALINFLVGQREDTLYAPRYSYLGFRAVKPGMTKDEVRSLLGEPLGTGRQYLNGDEIWWYSESPSSSNFRVRSVSSLRGVVSERTSMFMPD